MASTMAINPPAIAKKCFEAGIGERIALRRDGACAVVTRLWVGYVPRGKCRPKLQDYVLDQAIAAVEVNGQCCY